MRGNSKQIQTPLDDFFFNEKLQVIFKFTFQVKRPRDPHLQPFFLYILQTKKKFVQLFYFIRCFFIFTVRFYDFYCFSGSGFSVSLATRWKYFRMHCYEESSWGTRGPGSCVACRLVLALWQRTIVLQPISVDTTATSLLSSTAKTGIFLKMIENPQQ